MIRLWPSLKIRFHINPRTTTAVAASRPEETDAAHTRALQSPRTRAPLSTTVRRSLRSAGDWVRHLLRPQKVTVSLDEDSIKVVVFRGREVLAWGTVPIDAHVPKEDETDRRSQQNVDLLETLLRHLGVCRGRVVTDLPLHAPLVRHFQLPKMRRRYLDQVVVSEVLETLPFLEEEVDLAWRARSSGRGHEVVAIAVSKQTMDDRVRLLTEAGIRPPAAYSKAVALADAADVSDGIVVHVDPSYVEYVLLRQRVPQAVYVYKVELGENYPQAHRQAEVMLKAVEDVAGYAQSLDSADGSQPLPVVLTGHASRDSPLTKEIHQGLRRKVLPFSPPLAYPEHFPPDEYAVNLGLALADGVRPKVRRRNTADRLPSFNLLQARHLPRPLPVRPLAVFIGLLLLGAVALNFGGRVDTLSAEVAALSARHTNMQREERQHRLTLLRAGDTEADIQAIDRLTQDLESHLADLEGEMDTTLDWLETLTERSLPPDVALSSLVQQGGALDLMGKASSYQNVLRYIENLRASGLFSDVTLQEATASGFGSAPQSTQQARIELVSFQVKAVVSSIQDEESAPQSD